MCVYVYVIYALYRCDHSRIHLLDFVAQNQSADTHRDRERVNSFFVLIFCCPFFDNHGSGNLPQIYYIKYIGWINFSLP